jgi:hypothetical protein
LSGTWEIQSLNLSKEREMKKLIAKKAREQLDLRFTSLMHLFLYECYRELSKKKAGGIDGRTPKSYTEKEKISSKAGKESMHRKDKRRDKAIGDTNSNR